MSRQSFIEIISGNRPGLIASLTRGILRVAEVPYAWGAALKNRRFDRNPHLAQRVAVPVISVGNLTTGGTGKTPMVAWICERLLEQNLRVAIVSRGYRADKDGLNDEARELHQRLPTVPHLQNPDRVVAAEKAISDHNVQVIVLDDAFQHRRIHRDLNLLLIDAANPFGFGHQLPRGLLRESVSGIRRADAVILTRADMIGRERVDRIRNRIMSLRQNSVWIEAVHAPASWLDAAGNTSELDSLRGKRVAAFCGIGNPQGFVHTLERLGVEVVGTNFFPDHFHFDQTSLQEISAWARGLGKIDSLVCTHKDLVKIGNVPLGEYPLQALLVTMQINAGSELLASLLETTTVRIDSVR
jgi:tetraacyldisaccharide 4'-kinase